MGYDVARMLSLQRHDVTVIDTDPDKINHIKDSLDVAALQGSGTSATSLRSAGVRDTDLLVAVTNADEVNLIACMLAGRACDQRRPVTVARVRSDEFTGESAVLTMSDFGIDHLINPEESAATEVVSLLRRASATDLIEFADGRLHLVGVKVDAEAPMLRKTLREVAQNNSHLTFRVMGVVRGSRTIVPRGDETLHKGDHLFALAVPEEINEVARLFSTNSGRLSHVMILGGSPVGGRIAAQLEASAHGKRRMRTHVKLIEPDAEEAARLAAALPNTLVIHGDPTDIDLMVLEGLSEMDALVTASSEEESNLVLSLMAKHMGVRKTVAMLSKSAYIPISQTIGLDAAVSKKLAVSREVLRFLRGKHVLSVATVQGLDAEIMEIAAEHGSRVTRGPLKDQRIPNGVLVGAVVHRSTVEIATGNTSIQPGDRVIVFTDRDSVGHVEAYFGK